MDVQDVEKLVADLLATGEMNEDTQADLDRIRTEARAGQSHPDDLDYLRALHARLLQPGADAPAQEMPAEAGEDLREEVERLRAELAEAHRLIAELKAQAKGAGEG